MSVTELGRQGRPDDEVLADAKADGRIVVTHNRNDFEQLHRADSNHAGILSATRDRDPAALAGRIDLALAANPGIAGRHVRVNRPPSPPQPRP